jgi:hypothetical protein
VVVGRGRAAVVEVVVAQDKRDTVVGVVALDTVDTVLAHIVVGRLGRPRRLVEVDKLGKNVVVEGRDKQGIEESVVEDKAGTVGERVEEGRECTLLVVGRKKAPVVDSKEAVLDDSRIHRNRSPK